MEESAVAFYGRFAKEQNDSNEVAGLLDIATGDRMPFVKGNRKSVNVEANADVYHWLKTKPERSIMLLHNHPGQSYFSMNDLSFFVHYPQIGAMSIVTNQGEVWWIRKTDNYSLEKIKKVMDNAGERCGGDKDKLVELFLKGCYNKGIERGK